MAINKRPFDRRVTDRYLEKGQIKDSEVNSHMKGLPDDANNAQYVQMDLHDAEITGEEEGDEDEGEGETA